MAGRVPSTSFEERSVASINDADTPAWIALQYPAVRNASPASMGTISLRMFVIFVSVMLARHAGERVHHRKV